MSGVRKRHCVCFHGCAWAVSPQATTTTGSPTVGRKFSSPKEVILSWLDGGHRDHRTLYSCPRSLSKVVIVSSSPFSNAENGECFRSHRASLSKLIARLTRIFALSGYNGASTVLHKHMDHHQHQLQPIFPLGSACAARIANCDEHFHVVPLCRLWKFLACFSSIPRYLISSQRIQTLFH